jgi:succinate dehydrogenase/fumarate reductase flavoprotein subunit
MVRTSQDEADLVVVGASTGGLLGAVLAADRGCHVVVIERGKELGGGAGREVELIAAAGSRFQQAAGVDDRPERLADDIVRHTRKHVDAGLARALAEQGAGLVAWLADRFGAQVELLPAHVPTGHSVARLHLAGERLAADLVRAATRHSHINVRTGALAERLVRDDAGAVQGVGLKPERRGVAQAIGGHVLIACGGFAGADDLIATHAPAVAALPPPGPDRALGDGLRFGLAVGAGTRHLDACAVAPFLAMPGELIVEAPLVALGAVLVNQAGRRFTDETAASLPLASAVRAQPGRVAYLLFDERIATEARAADPFFARVILPRAGRRGATLENLAKQLELNLDGLRATVEALGTAAGGVDSFGRATRAFEPPFHAVRVTGARWRTLGGLAVDASARVLDTQGQPIPRLYATGGTADALGGDSAEGTLAGTTALAALGLARLAALDVVAATAERRAE